MRYLWVEDFNDGSETEEYLREKIESYFELSDDKLIVKKELSSAIEFLEYEENFYEIDAFLIDIRFPIGHIENIYEKYFADIVTLDFFNNNINDASGIMLYLLLVFRYHISQKKIAFISANVNSNNDKINRIEEMMKIIVKSKYAELSKNEKMAYRTDEQYLGKEIFKIKKETEKNWDTFISKELEVQRVDTDGLIKFIRSLPLTYPEHFKGGNDSEKYMGSSAQVKYNAVRSEFDKIGFAMPSAFEKPGLRNASEKGYLFLEWENDIYSNDYNIVRSSVLEMIITLDDYLKNEKKSDNLYKDFLKVISCSMNEKKHYDIDFFRRYLRSLKSIFTFECVDDMRVQCERGIKEISALWEATAKPIYHASSSAAIRSVELDGKSCIHNDSCYFACHATMKITRNWVGHQGIKDLNIKDLGFLFMISMRGMFHIEDLPEVYKDKYVLYEKKMLDLFLVEKNIVVELEDSLKYFIDLNNRTWTGKSKSVEIYDRISGIGHSESKVRRKVSMDDIYMLFYHALMKGSIYGGNKDIERHIKARTWKNWKSRYDSRFNTDN